MPANPQEETSNSLMEPLVTFLLVVVINSRETKTFDAREQRARRHRSSQLNTFLQLKKQERKKKERKKRSASVSPDSLQVRKTPRTGLNLRFVLSLATG